MNRPDTGELTSRNGHASAVPDHTGVPARRDDVPTQELVEDGQHVQPASARSNFGKTGELAKRLVARLIRFHTYEQGNVNASLRQELEHLRARLAVVEGATQRRFAANERELVEQRQELSAAARDFARLAGRMLAFENVRRVVARLRPFRDQVRAHRRELIELRQRFASVSARVTLVQHEIAPVRKAADRLHEQLDAAIAAVRTDLEAAVDRVRAGVSGEHEALTRRADVIFDSLRREGSALSAAVAEHGTHLSVLMDEVTRVAQTLADEQSFERIAAAEARLVALADVVGDFRSGFDQLAEVRARMADIAGAVNSLAHDFERETAEHTRLIAALRSDKPSSVVTRDDMTHIAQGLHEVAQGRIGDIAGRMDVLAAELANLRGRMLATPYTSVALERWMPARLSSPGDFDYLGFEDVFRGPEELVRERLRVYVALLEGRAPVVELGSGRGEFLELMHAAKLKTTGVEINPEAVARCRAKGLRNLVTSDANAYLESVAEGTAGAIFSAQFAEHLSFDELLRCLALSRSRLARGGLFIAETVNPNSVEAAKTFYVDPSHVKPLFPEVFAFLCRSVGFSQVRVFYPSGGGFDEQNPTSQHEYAVVATKEND